MSLQYNLKQIQVFYLVAKCDSFKDAAKLLKVSTPAVSIQIKNLEEALGFKLFDRKGTKVTLTPKAKEILPIIDKIFMQTEDLSKKIASFNVSQNKKITFGVHINPGRYLTPLLYRYVSRYLADLELVFINDDHPVSLKKLKNREIDIMIMDGKTLDDICMQKFIEFEVPFVVCKNNPILKQQPVSIRELRKIPSLFPSSISGYSRHVMQFYEENHIPLPKETHVMSSILFPSFIAKTRYGAFVNKLMVEKELKEGTIVELKLEKKPAPMNFYLAYLEESMKNKHIKELLNLLQDIEAFKNFRNDFLE